MLPESRGRNDATGDREGVPLNAPFGMSGKVGREETERHSMQRE